MKRLLSLAVLCVAVQMSIAQTATNSPAPRRTGGGQPQPITAKPDELAKIKEKSDQIKALVKDLKSKRAKPELIGDVEVFAHAGEMLLEYPDMFSAQAAIEH